MFVNQIPVFKLRNCGFSFLIAKKFQCKCGKQHLFNPSYRCMFRSSASRVMRARTNVFSLKNYNVVGFDLDGTILRYNIAEMIPLEYELLSCYLVKFKGYSNQLLGRLASSAEKDFLQKGLILDTELGNILKLDNNGRIIRANHGTKSMSDEEIVNVYGEKREWSVAMKFIADPLSAWNGPLAYKMRSLLDYFDISASLLFARAVDDVDSRNIKDQKQPYKVWCDILEALIHIYTRENFNNGESLYFGKLRDDPDRYLLKTSPIVINWLKNLRASGKKVFLLTGSHIDFANFTASYTIGKNWRDLFDLVICFARKPGFFHASRPFHIIDGLNECETIPFDTELSMNTVYSMGNWKQLENLFAKEIGINSCEVKALYIGDNLIQDVYAPQFSNIDSIAVSEEMLAEHSVANAYNPIQYEYMDVVASRYWGPYFFTDGRPTLWAETIRKYSKMCVPTLEHLAEKPIDHDFLMDNGIGFYPTVPGSS